MAAFRQGVVGIIGGVVGLAPHVLHHVGIIAGTALVAGAGGTLLFGALGLVASIPFLVGLHRRFGTWRAPAIALAIFAAMFALSTFVIGPAVAGVRSAPPGHPGVNGSTSSPVPAGHEGHHQP